jgi:hypothetical protein
MLHRLSCRGLRTKHYRQMYKIRVRYRTKVILFMYAITIYRIHDFHDIFQNPPYSPTPQHRESQAPLPNQSNHPFTTHLSLGASAPILRPPILLEPHPKPLILLHPTTTTLHHQTTTQNPINRNPSTTTNPSKSSKCPVNEVVPLPAVLRPLPQSPRRPRLPATHPRLRTRLSNSMRRRRLKLLLHRRRVRDRGCLDRWLVLLRKLYFFFFWKSELGGGKGFCYKGGKGGDGMGGHVSFYASFPTQKTLNVEIQR